MWGDTDLVQKETLSAKLQTIHITIVLCIIYTMQVHTIWV